MKYLMACLFSLGLLINVNAQDTQQPQQEGEDVITCVYLDENTITCFDPEYMEESQLEEQRMEEQKQEEWLNNQEEQGALQDTSGEARGNEEQLREEETEVIPEENINEEARGKEDLIIEDPNEPIQDTTRRQQVDPWGY
ncbi:MAG TPA: hypothetical protein VIK89_16665 [Cytophagaceae bacterium]